MINNFDDLCELVQPARNEPKSVARRLYKDTECGISFNAMEARVFLAGYAEGSDVDLPWYTLEYPFTAERFWGVVKQADQDGCDAWDEANDGGCENPECLDCYG